MSYYGSLSSLVVIVGILGSCQPVREYTLVLYNSSSEIIYDVHVRYDSFVSLGGVLGASVTAKEGGVRVPVPERVVVEWRLKDGTQFRQEVEIGKQINRERIEEVWFEIQGDKVIVYSAPHHYLPGDTGTPGPRIE